MFEKIRNLKNKKGFTLVELIVVLVILAILAALLVPALTGYIDKARKQSIGAETRQCVMAAQTIASEKYGTTTTTTGITEADIDKAAVKKLAEVPGEVTAIAVKRLMVARVSAKSIRSLTLILFPVSHIPALTAPAPILILCLKEYNSIFSPDALHRAFLFPWKGVLIMPSYLDNYTCLRYS
mgnify:CR=1 FL=1